MIQFPGNSARAQVEELVTAHPGCGPRKLRFVPEYTFPCEANCEVFKWVPSITALTTDRWLANHQLVIHPAELFAV